MTLDQGLLFAVLVLALAGFVWGRFRYDMVAFAALFAATVLGLVPMDKAFDGFSDAATVSVAAVFIVTRALISSGALDRLARAIGRFSGNPTIHIGALSLVGGAMSAFMNNVAALSIVMPVAIRSSRDVGRSPSLVLMPLAFATVLGGIVTLIGTPPNILLSGIREDFMGAPYAMFDFAPVGLPTAVAGILFMTFVGWRLIPKSRRARNGGTDLFQISDFVTEVRAEEGSSTVGQAIQDIEKKAGEYDVTVIGMVRGDSRLFSGIRYLPLAAGDALVIEGAPDAIAKFVAALKLTQVGTDGGKVPQLTSPDTVVTEVVVTRNSEIIGRTARMVGFARRFGINLLGISRQGKPIRQRLRQVEFRSGDALLLQGDADRIAEAVQEYGLLSIAERPIPKVGRLPASIAVASFASAILLTSVGLLSLPIALGLAALTVVLTGVLPLRDLYESIDWPVIVLLAALIPVGGAIETTGAAQLLADALASLSGSVGPVVLLGIVLVLTMWLSDILNNAATVVIVAPVAFRLAEAIGANPDTYFMAVAIGASCAFLTPIGHQNNTLVMGPGGYAFSDYTRVGLPLEVLIVAVSMPLLLVFWPL